MWKKKDSHMFKYYAHIDLVTLNKLQMTCVGEGKKKDFMLNRCAGVLSRVPV